MLSMFKEKDCEGNGTACWSMTRIVAFLAALTLNYALIVMAKNSHVHDIAWPFCAMYVVTLLAVPIQAFLRMIHAWLSTGPGQKLLKTVLEKVQAKGISLGGDAAPPPSSITTTTEVTQGVPSV